MQWECLRTRNQIHLLQPRKSSEKQRFVLNRGHSHRMVKEYWAGVTKVVVKWIPLPCGNELQSKLLLLGQNVIRYLWRLHIRIFLLAHPGLFWLQRISLSFLNRMWLCTCCEPIGVDWRPKGVVEIKSTLGVELFRQSWYYPKEQDLKFSGLSHKREAATGLMQQVN